MREVGRRVGISSVTPLVHATSTHRFTNSQLIAHKHHGVLQQLRTNTIPTYPALHTVPLAPAVQSSTKPSPAQPSPAHSPPPTTQPTRTTALPLRSHGPVPSPRSPTALLASTVQSARKPGSVQVPLHVEAASSLPFPRRHWPLQTRRMACPVSQRGGARGVSVRSG